MDEWCSAPEPLAKRDANHMLRPANVVPMKFKIKLQGCKWTPLSESQLCHFMFFSCNAWKTPEHTENSLKKHQFVLDGGTFVNAEGTKVKRV